MSATTKAQDVPLPEDAATAPSVLVHGGRVLPAVTVDTYNEELRDEDGFVGDRASRRAFHAILADWRDRLKERGEDPFGDIPMEGISKSRLDKMPNAGDPVSAGLVHTVVGEFAGELATVIRRFLRLDTWKDTQRIVIGGGMIGSRIGELAMGRTGIILAADGIKIELAAIQNDPEEAGLIDRAKQEKIKLAPFMGIGCPGLIDEQGSILKGGQNLPGNWEGKSFNLAAALSAHLPRIDGHEIFIQIHNDAVVQGLSEVPNMKDVEHWGVMTIGTGLGNARFTNRE